VDEKNLKSYTLAVRSAVRGLWTEAISSAEFVVWMRTAIEREFWFAVEEGIKGCDIKLSDLEPEETEFVTEAIQSEEEYIANFAIDITVTRDQGGNLQSMLDRAELWINRYNEMVSKARVMICQNQKLEWVLGATEEHCTSCERLNGIVKRASFWEKAGVFPQGAPNPKIECGGWQCDCRLRPTNKRVTPGPLPRLP